MELKRPELIKKRKNRTFKRETAQKALANVLNKIKEVNENQEFIYKVTKAVLFGSYINSNKERVGDIDIAIYVELKDKSISEDEQNYSRALKRTSSEYIPFFCKMRYGKEEVFRYIKDKKSVVEPHDGVSVDEESKRYEELNYIYIDKYKELEINTENKI